MSNGDKCVCGDKETWHKKCYAEQAEASSLSDLLWCDNTPTEKGFYWCYQNKKTRMVTVWGYEDKRYTNEDGGAPVNDKIYKGAKWYGPIEPPPAP